MKKGILIYDKKDSEINSWFIKKLITEGAKEGLEINLVLTEDIAENTDNAGNTEVLGENLHQKLGSLKNNDFAILRNRSYMIADELERLGVRCFNTSNVIKLGNDKWAMYEALSKKNIPLMHTQRTRLPYPFVMKKRNGHGGANVYLVNNSDEYGRVCNAIWDEYLKTCTVRSYQSVDELIRDEYIYQLKASDTGRDIRVYVLGENILTAMERTSDSDFRANFSLGGMAYEYALSSDEMELAARVADILKPDFIGIDIIYNNGSPIVNEIEDAVGTRMLYSSTDIDAAAEYARYISESL